MGSSKFCIALLALAAIGLLSCCTDAKELLGRRSLSEEFPPTFELSNTRLTEDEATTLAAAEPPVGGAATPEAAPPIETTSDTPSPPDVTSEEQTPAILAPSEAINTPDTGLPLPAAPTDAGSAANEATSEVEANIPTADLVRLGIGKVDPTISDLELSAAPSGEVDESLDEDPSVSDRRKKRRRPVQPSPGQCHGGPTFWTSEFEEVVSNTLGGFSPKECHGEPTLGGQIGNKALAFSVKNQLERLAGCVDDFEVLVWAGVHGHDHQGANVLTARDSQMCDGGMYGIHPGRLCESKGGTVHRFCTGQGKSYAIFINPKGRRTRNLDIAAIAQSCGDQVNLLINFTKCMNDGPAGKGLRGVIVLPYDGIEAPNGKSFRHNQWQSTSCTTKGWLWCSREMVNHRDLAVFAVQPLA